MTSSVQSNPLSPVPTGVDVLMYHGKVISSHWNQWFVELREKVNVINSTLASWAGINPVSGLTPGTYGDTTHYPIVTVNEFGMITAIENQTASGSSPLTTKGDLYCFGTENARLPVGTDGQVLAANSTKPLGLEYIDAGTPTLPLTTKGDLLGRSDSALVRIPVGTDGTVATADSTASSGISWKPPSSSGGSASALATLILADSPSLFYKCDESTGTILADSSGNGYDLTLKGSNDLAYTEVIPGATLLHTPTSTTSSNGASRNDASGLTVPLDYSWTWIGLLVAWSPDTNVSVCFAVAGPTDSAADNFQIAIYCTNDSAGAATIVVFWEHGSGTNDQFSIGSLPVGVPFLLTIWKDSSSKTLTYFINGRKISNTSYSSEPTGGTNVKTYINSLPASSTVGGVTDGYIAFFPSLIPEANIKAYAQAAGLF